MRSTLILAVRSVEGRVHNILVCRTCPRKSSEKSGMGAAIQSLLAEEDFGTDVHFLGLECLGGCPRPLCVAFDADEKWRIRFGGLTVDDAPDVIAALYAYITSFDGLVGKSTKSPLPERLQSRISARSPKPGMKLDHATSPMVPRAADRKPT